MLGNKIRVSSIILMLIMSVAIVSVKAQVEERFFTASIIPDTGFCDQTQLYVIRVHNDLDSTANQYIGSVTIAIPAGWTDVSIQFVFSDQPEWDGFDDGTYIYLYPTGIHAGQHKLTPCQSVWVLFTATAPSTPSPPPYEWTTTAYVGTDWSGSTFTLKGPQPTVDISCVTCTPETVTSTVTDTVTDTETLTETVTQAAPTPGPVYVFVGAPIGDAKPRGTLAAHWIDASAAAILEGMVLSPKFSFDTNSIMVTQGNGGTAGEPTPENQMPPPLPGPYVYVMSGGPIVSGPVAYYEQSGISPVYWSSTIEDSKLIFEFVDRSTGVIVPTKVPFSELGTFPSSVSQDYFLIECFVDPDGNTVLIIYGYTGIGTFAGALYYKEYLHPTGSPSDPGGDMFTHGAWIYHWIDLNGNHLPEITDSFTQVYP